MREKEKLKTGKGTTMTKDYAKMLAEKGLTDNQIATILSGWTTEKIESLLRGECKAPSNEGIVAAIIDGMKGGRNP